jgi:hypothetical protein
MLGKIDKKMILTLITTLEEEIETLGGEEDKEATKTTHKTDNIRGRSILPMNYISALISYLILGIVFLYIVVSHIQSTSRLPDDFNVRFILT